MWSRIYVQYCQHKTSKNCERGGRICFVTKVCYQGWRAKIGSNSFEQWMGWSIEIDALLFQGKL